MTTTTVGLEHLFGSDTRVRLLRLFLQNPEERFFVRELVRRLGVQIHGVRRELSNLERLGIIRAAEATHDDPTMAPIKGPLSQRKYYASVTEHVLYSELKALLLKADLLSQRDLVGRFQTIGKIHVLVLTGRFVGVKHAPSDLLLVGIIDKKPLQHLIAQLEKEYGHEINYTVLTPKEYAYRREVTDRFLFEILEGKKVVLFDAEQTV